MTSERRRFFRIDDEVMLGYEVIEQAGVDARLDDFWQNEHAFSIRNNYNFQIEQQIADFSKIEKKMPELARYLSVQRAKQVAPIRPHLGLPADMKLPWHRVIRSSGRSAFDPNSRHFRQQRDRLREEGVTVTDGKVDMQAFRWEPDLDELLWKPSVIWDES